MSLLTAVEQNVCPVRPALSDQDEESSPPLLKVRYSHAHSCRALQPQLRTLIRTKLPAGSERTTLRYRARSAMERVSNKSRARTMSWFNSPPPLYFRRHLRSRPLVPFH
jgi:hypothetical protein